jgi:uncharacterized protein involved in outer membrane biogenesis
MPTDPHDIMPAPLLQRPSAPAPASVPGRAAWRQLVPTGLLRLWLLVALLLGGLGLGEMLGWPLLHRPLQWWLSQTLQRPVRLQEPHLRLLGSVRFEAAQVQVDAPAWSRSPHLLLAHDVAIELAYAELWHVWREQPWRIERLHVASLDLQLARLADGRATWQFGAPPPGPSEPLPAELLARLPSFGRLLLGAGTLALDDQLNALALQGRLALVDGASPLGSPWKTARVSPRGLALPARRSNAGGDGLISSAHADEPARTAAPAAADSAGAGQGTTGRAATRPTTRPATGSASSVGSAGSAGSAMGPARAASGSASGSAGAAPASAPWPQSMLQFSASGHYARLPLRVDLLLGGNLPGSETGAAAAARPLALNLSASLGAAGLAFDGRISDVQTLRRLSGRFRLSGPSLAAVGDPVGVTLPSTRAFSSEGELVKQGRRWNLTLNEARIGASRLAGSFSFEPGRAVPMLRGHLSGTRLVLADLGPALGTTSLTSRAFASLAGPDAAGTPTQVAQAAQVTQVALPAQSAKAASAASSADQAHVKGVGMLLPDRDFDLPALRAMNADVAIQIDEVDLGTTWLEALRPLKARVLLQEGVLSLREIDARTGQGRLQGRLDLDGRGGAALLDADLRWDGVRLEDWLHPQLPSLRKRPPALTGRLSGSARLQGRGSSTAGILANLQGQARAELHDGTISHLAIEVAGLDLAASLGLLIRGDDRLPVQCGLADLVAQAGVLRPRMMVLDTRDSAVWVTGSLSLASEALDLRAFVRPKDFSPLALRSPLRVRGSFAHPEVSLDKSAVGKKLATALLLSIVNPLAALIPLVDLGEGPDRRGPGAPSAGCAGQQAPADDTRPKAAADGMRPAR